jgi:hypothetical protein
MPITSRRAFLGATGAFALATAASPARAAMGPNDKFDLVIKGGDVLDPSQSLRGQRDIGIRFGVIEAVEGDIPAARANRVLDAAGKLVTPGLIDLPITLLVIRSWPIAKARRKCAEGWDSQNRRPVPDRAPSRNARCTSRPV